MIGIVDYGLGNVRAFINIYHRLGIPVDSVKTADELIVADRLILPGVGAFDWAMSRLTESGMLKALHHRVWESMVPILGVCVGMQMMARCSEEGELPGLGWIPGMVKRFDEAVFRTQTYLPHMGWNDVQAVAHPLFKDLIKPRFYFLHSYFFLPDSADQILAETEYSVFFSSAVHNQHVFGVQFHPEKSHHWGVQLLKNFAEV